MKVFVTRALPDPGVTPLLEAGLEVSVNPHDRPPTRDELRVAARDADALLTLVTDRVDADLLDAAPRVRVVANLAVGYDNVDVAAATARGVLVTNTPDVLTDATADLAWTLLLAAARRAGEGERLVRSGRWTGWTPTQLVGLGVYGKTLGVIGLGRIGAAVARRARGFDMRVLYHNRRRDPRAEAETGATFVTLERLLEDSDFVSVNAPLTPETRHLVDAAALARMKPTAVLVNTARGPLVDEAALAAALRERRLAAAGLDVYEREPEVDAALLELDNVVLLPHLGSATREARAAMVRVACANIVAVLNGDAPLTPLNPEVTRR